MKTNNVSKKLFALLTAFCLTTTLIHAQTSTQNNDVVPPPPPPPNAAPMAPPPSPGNVPPPAPRQSLQEVTTYKGTVAKLVTNDDYVYDGFYMLNNSDSLLVKFPPHLGTQITALIKPGTSVSVNGVMNVAPMGEKEIRMIKINVGNNTISDTTTKLATPPAETYTSGNGKITQLQKNREGAVSGVIVDDKTILKIPPHVATQFNSLAQTNTAVAYTGMEKSTSNGEASTANYKIVHCQTLTINGKQYLVQ